MWKVFKILIAKLSFDENGRSCMLDLVVKGLENRKKSRQF